MNQDDINKLIIQAVVSSSLISSIITVIFSNIFIGRREREKERREVLENIIRPAEDYLLDLRSSIFFVLTKLEPYQEIHDTTLYDLLKKHLDDIPKVYVVRRLEILEDKPINILSKEFETNFTSYSRELEKFLISKKNDVGEIFPPLQSSISQLLRYLDFFRLNHYRPTEKDNKLKKKHPRINLKGLFNRYRRK